MTIRKEVDNMDCEPENVIKAKYDLYGVTYYVGDNGPYFSNKLFEGLHLYDCYGLDGIEITLDLDIQEFKSNDIYFDCFSEYIEHIYHYVRPGGYIKITAPGAKMNDLMSIFKLNRYPYMSRNINEDGTYEVIGRSRRL